MKLKLSQLSPPPRDRISLAGAAQETSTPSPSTKIVASPSILASSIWPDTKLSSPISDEQRSRTMRLTTTPTSSSSESPTADGLHASSSPGRLHVAGRIRGRPILVKVGLDGDEFFIHETLLKATSKFFRAALSGNWVESNDGIVRLPAEDPLVFGIYFHFLYERKFSIPLDDLDDETSEIWPLLVSAWILDDTLQDTDFKDAVLDQIIELTKKNVKGYSYFPIKQVTTLIYKCTVAGSPLRKLVVEQHTYHGRPDWLSDVDCEEFDVEFLRDLSVSLLRDRKPPAVLAPDRLISTYRYHEHAEDRTECYKKK